MIALNNIDDSTFRKIMELLTRIGVTKKDHRFILYQISNIIKIKGSSYLIHYKEIIDEPLTDHDVINLNTIACLLEKWDMVELNSPISENERKETIFILGKERKERENWKIYSVITPEKIKKFIDGK